MGHQTRLLTFTIRERLCAVALSPVREVVANGSMITPVPMAPEWLRGVTNIRGTVLPVIDISSRLGLGPCDSGRRSCLIIVTTHIDREESAVAVLVDAVDRVVEEVDVQDAPEFGADLDGGLLTGMVRINDGLVPILDCEAILESGLIDSSFFPSLRNPPSAEPHR